MKLSELALASGLVWGAMALSVFLGGCRDDSPCDPGQYEKNTQCYPIATGGGGGGNASGGADSGGSSGGVGVAGAADESAGAPATAMLDTDFGTACKDTTAFSDCGGKAPICADLTALGQTKMCTQISCSPGEANAGACPSTFSCFATPGYPSVCIKK